MFLTPSKQTSFLELNFSSLKKIIFIKIGYFRFFTRNANELKFFPSKFFACGWYATQAFIQFIFMFLYRKTICDNEKRHSVNLDHGKCKSQKQTRNVQWVTQTDKWKHSNNLCTCTYNVPLWFFKYYLLCMYQMESHQIPCT